jgi:galactitol-specific phosphotransferase system IIB component
LGLEPALDELGLKDTSIECTSLGQAQSLLQFVDLIIIPSHLAELLDIPKGKPLVKVNNLINKNEVKEGVTKALEEYYPELLKK